MRRKAAAGMRRSACGPEPDFKTEADWGPQVVRGVIRPPVRPVRAPANSSSTYLLALWLRSRLELENARTGRTGAFSLGSQPVWASGTTWGSPDRARDGSDLSARTTYPQERAGPRFDERRRGLALGRGLRAVPYIWDPGGAARRDDASTLVAFAPMPTGGAAISRALVARRWPRARPQEGRLPPRALATP